MREITDDDSGIVLHIPDANTPILGLNGWRQRCWITNYPQNVDYIDVTWIGQSPIIDGRRAYYAQATRQPWQSFYVMGLLPISAEGEYFRRVPITLSVRVNWTISGVSDSAIFSETINLCFGAIPMVSSYFNVYPYTFTWANCEFYFSDSATYSYATQYCDVATWQGTAQTYPYRAAGAIVAEVNDVPLDCVRSKGTPPPYSPPASGTLRLFDVEALDFNADNCDYVPQPYYERQYRDQNGDIQTLSGGGYGFFRVDTASLQFPSSVSVATGEDYSDDICLLYDGPSPDEGGEIPTITGSYLDPDTGEWVEDEYCSIIWPGQPPTSIGGTTYEYYQVTGLWANGLYEIHHSGGRYMIFSRDYQLGRGAIYFNYTYYKLKYPKVAATDTLSRITHNSDDLDNAKLAGCIVDYSSCPDLTIKWLDVAGYVWSLPLFLDSATGDLGSTTDPIRVSANNDLIVYGGSSSITYYSPILNGSEMWTIRHIKSSPFYAIKGRGVKAMQYDLNVDHWFFAIIKDIDYEFTKRGGRVRITVQCIDERDPDSIAKTMYLQNLSRG